MYLLPFFTQHIEHKCFLFLSVSDRLSKVILLKETQKLITLLNLKLLLLKYLNYTLTVGGGLFVCPFGFEHIRLRFLKVFVLWQIVCYCSIVNYD